MSFSPIWTGIENIADHITNGPRKFLGSQERKKLEKKGHEERVSEKEQKKGERREITKEIVEKLERMKVSMMIFFIYFDMVLGIILKIFHGPRK